MSWIVDQKQSLKLKITKDFSSYFDELVNIQVSGRRSEQWFVDENRLVIKMRPWTSKYGSNTLTGWNSTSRLFFHTDFLWNRFAVRWYGSRVYWNKAWVWTDIWVDFWWNDFYYNTVKLPMNLNLSIPTEYTNAAAATNSERVKKAAWDAWWASNIGKYIFITDNTGDNQSYRWCFSDISDYNTTTGEYILWTSWIIGKPDPTTPTTIIGIASWTKYQIYDQLWEYLQVMNWVSYDRYFMSSWTTITENTAFQWFATKSLRVIYAITSSQFISKQIPFNNAMWTFNKGTLYESAWALWNPFFHNFTGALTSSNNWYIIDIFQFWNRLIIWGNNFAKYIDTSKALNTISTSWGIKKNGFINFDTDAYVFSSNKGLYSLVETIKGTLVPNNIWKQMQNYMNQFNTEICMWFDGQRFFLYWQVDGSTEWKIVVLDVLYKFWSVWTWLRPSSIVSENWVTYLTQNNWEKVVYIDSTVETDTSIAIEQKITTREVDLWDVFSAKILPSLLFWFDNYTQDINVKVFASLNRKQATISNKTFNILENYQLNPAPPIWESEIGSWILLWEPFIQNISYPLMEKIDISTDQANIWKVEIKWVDWSPFYLCQFDVQIWFYGDQQNYFDPSHTK